MPRDHHPALQPPGQEPEVPEQTRGAQLGLPLEPAGALEQVPSLPVRLQASQAPSQPLLQQAPSSQLTLTHSFEATQPTPRTFFGTQAVPLQYWPATHWASKVQLEGQAGPAPEQRYGVQAGTPAEPLGMLVHVPVVPPRLQALQPPTQVVLQQTPSTQKPEAQSAATEQEVPSGAATRNG